ncbi:MAG: hypothetical protein J0H68_03745 [Sphingobacteriia bacterium]|nr:hypothetical protein [Sphingobacteriia bacterium]
MNKTNLLKHLYFSVAVTTLTASISTNAYSWSLFSSDSEKKYEDVKEDIKNKAHDAKETAKIKAHNAKESVKDTADKTIDKIKDKSHDAKESIQEGADKAANKAYDAKEFVKEKAHNAADVTAEKAHDAKEFIKEKAHDAADVTAEKAHDAKEFVKEKAHNAADVTAEKAYDTKEFIKEKAHDAKEFIKEKAHDAADVTAEKAHDAKEFIKEKAHDAADVTAEKAQADVTAEKAHDAKKAVKNTINANTPTKMEVLDISKEGNAKLVKIKLTKRLTGKPVIPKELKETYAHKVHLLIVDDSLDDYAHVHPKALNENGIYQFVWHPKKEGNYRVWANITPLDTNIEEYVMGDLIQRTDLQTQPLERRIDRTTTLHQEVNGYNFDLTFNTANVKSGKSVIGVIKVTDSNGAYISSFEPIMGTYNHLVGFMEDFATVTHVHPLATKKVLSKSDRGGPDFKFQFQPEKTGFMRLFAQFKINGEEIYVPFGFNID